MLRHIGNLATAKITCTRGNATIGSLRNHDGNGNVRDYCLVYITQYGRSVLSLIFNRYTSKTVKTILEVQDNQT